MKTSEKSNPLLYVLSGYYWIPALQLQSKSNTWHFAGESLIRRSIHCKLFAFAVWCSTGFKEQLIMTLWTHLWNNKMRDTKSHIRVALWPGLTPSGVNVQKHLPFIFQCGKKSHWNQTLWPFFFLSTLAQRSGSFQLSSVRFNSFTWLNYKSDSFQPEAEQQVFAGKLSSSR